MMNSERTAKLIQLVLELVEDLEEDASFKAAELDEPPTSAVIEEAYDTCIMANSSLSDFFEQLHESYATVLVENFELFQDMEDTEGFDDLIDGFDDDDED